MDTIEDEIAAKAQEIQELIEDWSAQLNEMRSTKFKITRQFALLLRKVEALERQRSASRPLA